MDTPTVNYVINPNSLSEYERQSYWARLLLGSHQDGSHLNIGRIDNCVIFLRFWCFLRMMVTYISSKNWWEGVEWCVYMSNVCIDFNYICKYPFFVLLKWLRVWMFSTLLKSMIEYGGISKNVSLQAGYGFRRSIHFWYVFINESTMSLLAERATNVPS